MNEQGNTRINYTYRDASNYKQPQTFVAAGEITEDQEKIIMDSLLSDDTFIAEQVGMLVERFESITEDDHCYVEFENIELTDDAPTDGTTISELAEAFREAGEFGWDDVKYAVA